MLVPWPCLEEEVLCVEPPAGSPGGNHQCDSPRATVPARGNSSPSTVLRAASLRPMGELTRQQAIDKGPAQSWAG